MGTFMVIARPDVFVNVAGVAAPRRKKRAETSTDHDVAASE